jgi:hypothetical protein
MSTDLTLEIDALELTSALRIAPLNGAPSSDDYNDSEQEKLIDLSTLVNFVNNTIIPMLNALAPLASTGLEGSGVYGDSTSQEPLFFNSQTGTWIVLSDSLRMVYGQQQSTITALANMQTAVAALQARISSSNQNDISLALQGFTSTLNSQLSQIRSLQQAMSNLQALSITSADAQEPTPSVAPQSIESVVVTWTVPFTDNNYTVGLSINDASGYLQIMGFSYLDGGVGIVVRVLNTDQTAVHTGVVHALARVNALVAS